MQTELDDVPLYVVVKEVLNKEAHVEAVEINYLTFYAFNGPYTIGVPPFAFEAGAHDGDWEHFTVRCALSGVATSVCCMLYVAYSIRLWCVVEDVTIHCITALAAAMGADCQGRCLTMLQQNCRDNLLQTANADAL